MGLGSKRYCFDIEKIKKFVKYQGQLIYDQYAAQLKEYNDKIKEYKEKNKENKDKLPEELKCFQFEWFEEIKYQQCKVDWELELLYLPFAPKEPVAEFADEGGKIFTSKKTPLMIVCNLATEKESEAAL